MRLGLLVGLLGLLHPLHPLQLLRFFQQLPTTLRLLFWFKEVLEEEKQGN